METTRVKIFSAGSSDILEDKINAWLENNEVVLVDKNFSISETHSQYSHYKTFAVALWYQFPKTIETN
jgi:hypothetical protein